MLHAISWKDFLTLMGLGVFIYYGWLVIRYLRVGFLRGLTGKREGTGLPFTEWRKEKEAPGAVGGGEVNGVAAEAAAIGGERPAVAGGGAAVGGEALPGEAKQLALPLPAVQLVKPVAEEKTLAQLAAELDVELWPLYERAEKGMERKELLYAITLLLDKELYRPLKGTYLQEPLSKGIFEGLAKHGSIHLDEGEMNGLWRR